MQVQYNKQRETQSRPGQFVGVVPGYDVVLDGPFVYVLVDGEREKLVAIYYGAGSVYSPITPEALRQAEKFGAQARHRKPETVAKSSMGPVDIPLFRAQENARRREANKTAKEKLPLPTGPLVVSASGLGALEWEEAAKKSRLSEKDFRNTGRRQYLGGQKLAQNMAAHKTGKTGERS